MSNIPYTKMMQDRLAFIRSLIPSERTKFSTIDSLRCKGLVTHNYGVLNLRVDIWFIDGIPPAGMGAYERCSTESSINIWMATVIMAMIDARSGRPCDLGAWRCDEPPYGIETCTKCEDFEAHVCSDEAVKFLSKWDEATESAFGMPRFTIRDYVLYATRKKTGWSSGLLSRRTVVTR